MTINDWLQVKRRETEMRSSTISLSQSKEWREVAGAVRHETEGFFSIEGVRSTSGLDELNCLEQPIINQPEVGILGFIVTPGETGLEWMVQAKAEPGNIGLVQMAPSVQATYSNYMQKHGGQATHYLSFFTDTSETLLSDGLYSEQGTRFLRKFNRNVVCLAPQKLNCVNSDYSWLPAHQMRAAVMDDFSINTDARSVIVTAPWDLMSDTRRPFANSEKMGWGDLLLSYQAPIDRGQLDTASEFLKDARTRANLQTSFLPLAEVNGWEKSEKFIKKQENGGPFEVNYFSIHAPSREKQSWDQPLLSANDEDQVLLLCQKQGGTLKFLLRLSYEIGLVGGVEYGPTFKKESRLLHPDWLETIVERNLFVTKVSVRQSDEGGRFMNSVCQYSIGELDETTRVPEEFGSKWLTLGELEALCRRPEMLTNEARSVVSLLLGYA